AAAPVRSPYTTLCRSCAPRLGRQLYEHKKTAARRCELYRRYRDEGLCLPKVGPGSVKFWHALSGCARHLTRVAHLNGFAPAIARDRKSTRLNSSHVSI